MVRSRFTQRRRRLAPSGPTVGAEGSSGGRASAGGVAVEPSVKAIGGGDEAFPFPAREEGQRADGLAQDVMGGGGEGGGMEWVVENLALVEDAPVFVAVACGDKYTVAVTQEGHVYSWGEGS